MIKKNKIRPKTNEENISVTFGLKPIDTYRCLSMSFDGLDKE